MALIYSFVILKPYLETTIYIPKQTLNDLHVFLGSDMIAMYIQNTSRKLIIVSIYCVSCNHEVQNNCHFYYWKSWNKRCFNRLQGHRFRRPPLYWYRFLLSTLIYESSTTQAFLLTKITLQCKVVPLLVLRITQLNNI